MRQFRTQRLQREDNNENTHYSHLRPSLHVPEHDSDAVPEFELEDVAVEDIVVVVVAERVVDVVPVGVIVSLGVMVAERVAEGVAVAEHVAVPLLDAGSDKTTLRMTFLSDCATPGEEYAVVNKGKRLALIGILHTWQPTYPTRRSQLLQMSPRRPF